MPPKIILDTDIGYFTDADDAIALAYLLLRDDIDLLGVTTVGKLSPQRAELAEVICTQLGRAEMPVFAGADRPICQTPWWPENPVRPWPADLQPRPQRTYPPDRALAWLIETIRRHPGEVTLITIGQFTNLATLLLADPEAAGMLARVVSMGGRLEYPPEKPRSECNVGLDPVAMTVVTQRTAVPFVLAPLDSVRGMGLSKEMLDTMLAGDRLSAVRDTWGAWGELKKTSGVGLADPFTVAAALEADLAPRRRGRVGVRLGHTKLEDGQPLPGDEVLGYTTFHADPAGPHEVFDPGDKAAIHVHLMDVFARSG